MTTPDWHPHTHPPTAVDDASVSPELVAALPMLAWLSEQLTAASQGAGVAPRSRNIADAHRAMIATVLGLGPEDDLWAVLPGIVWSLRRIAYAYADRPGYIDAWRPEGF